MSKKVSVIIPVYNVEKYLKRCVDSVLNQTYKDLEVILVDDGSTDGSPKICDEYAAIDNRVIVIHKTNGGQSAARNYALNIPPSGDYITFVDSDDWIKLDTYEYCLSIIERTGADIVQFGRALAIDTNELQSIHFKESVKMYEGKEILQQYLLESTKTGSYAVWRCVFSKQIIGNIRFREGKINEDIDWKYIVLANSQKMADSNQVKYYYNQTGNSTSGAPLKKRDFQLREAADILFELTSKENYGTIAYLGRVKKARTAFSLLSKIAYFGIADPAIDKYQTVKELTAEHRNNLGTLLNAPIPLSRKLLAVMFAINYKMTEKVIRFVKKI